MRVHGFTGRAQYVRDFLPRVTGMNEVNDSTFRHTQRRQHLRQGQRRFGAAREPRVAIRTPAGQLRRGSESVASGEKFAAVGVGEPQDRHVD